MNAAHLSLGALAPEITRALCSAFGDAPVENLAVLSGGRSGATLLSMTVAGRGYVLRRCDPARPGHARRTPREITCMTIASERGVAPRLLYADANAGIAIMERIAIAPLDPPRSRPQRIERVAKTLRRLHEGPAFPPATSTTFMLSFVGDTLRAGGHGALPERLVGTMSELAEITARFAESAPCHVDLNPGNVLEAEDAVYLIDWELAGNSDPFFDLGQLGVFSFPAPEDRADLLGAYLGRPPSEEERARVTLARVMALGFYATSFVLSTAASGGAIPISAAPLSTAEMLRLLSTARERASPEVIAASLLEEMRRESETAAYGAAKLRGGARVLRDRLPAEAVANARPRAGSVDSVLMSMSWL